MKICTKCNIEKPLTDFVNNKSKPRGKASYCKPCWNTKNKSKETIMEITKKIKQEHAHKLEAIKLSYRDDLYNYLQRKYDNHIITKEKINTILCY